MVSGKIQDFQISHVFEESRLDEVDLVSVKTQMKEAGVVCKSFLSEILHQIMGEVQHLDAMRKVGWGTSKAEIAAKHIHLDLRTKTNTQV